MEKIDEVFCVWGWVSKAKEYRKRWKLLKVAVGYDGYCENERVRNWPHLQMTKPVKDRDDRLSIPGKIITGWSMSGGVFLVDFNAPDQTDWISLSGWEWIKKQHDWWILIESGAWLVEGTVAEAQKLMEKK